MSQVILLPCSKSSKGFWLLSECYLEPYHRPYDLSSLPPNGPPQSFLLSGSTDPSSLFLELANVAHAPGPLHCCFLCLAHSLLRYPHDPLFHLLRSLLQCQRRLIWLYQVNDPLGPSPPTLLGSLWSISYDILYSVIYGLFPQPEG